MLGSVTFQNTWKSLAPRDLRAPAGRWRQRADGGRRVSKRQHKGGVWRGETMTTRVSQHAQGIRFLTASSHSTSPSHATHSPPHRAASSSAKSICSRMGSSSRTTNGSVTNKVARAMPASTTTCGAVVSAWEAGGWAGRHRVATHLALTVAICMRIARGIHTCMHACTRPRKPQTIDPPTGKGKHDGEPKFGDQGRKQALAAVEQHKHHACRARTDAECGGDDKRQEGHPGIVGCTHPAVNRPRFSSPTALHTRTHARTHTALAPPRPLTRDDW